jgi:15,16-dihydrobiliverdin:ferredoxin oxidoreductase
MSSPVFAQRLHQYGVTNALDAGVERLSAKDAVANQLGSISRLASLDQDVSRPLRKLALLFLAMHFPAATEHITRQSYVNSFQRLSRAQSLAPSSDDSFKPRHGAAEDFFSYAKEFSTTGSMQSHAHMTWMVMMQEQLRAMKELGFENLPFNQSFMMKTNDAKGAKIVNLALKNKIFRKVRLTYLDVGDQAQVFNSVFYPSFEYDLPLLGIDLISLNRKMILAGVDFMPLYPTEEYEAKYIEELTPIKARYSSLQGNHSGKIYDDSTFFSKNMLFGRFKDEQSVDSEIIPASKEYLHTYLQLVASAIPDTSEPRMASVKHRQTLYDRYNAEKDPAVGFFNKYFGKDWTESYVHDFLFDLSREA